MWSFFKRKKKVKKKIKGDDFSVNVDGNNNTVTSTINVLKVDTHDFKPFTKLTNDEIDSLKNRLENKAKIGELDNEVVQINQELNQLEHQKEILEIQVKNLLEKTDVENLVNMPELYM